MRTLKPILSRVNQLAEQAKTLGAGNLSKVITERLWAARARCAAGLPPIEPAWWRESDESLRQRWAHNRRLAERLIAARRRRIAREN